MRNRSLRRTSRRAAARSASPLAFRLCLLLLCLAAPARAQQPFVTDDADVVERGKFELQVADEYDVLQRVLYPSKAQNVLVAELTYGVWKNVEVGFAPPLLSLRNARVVTPQFISGLGDSTLHVKYNFYQEREGSRLPAMAITGEVQFPTGSLSKDLGTGLYDYYVNGVLQKSASTKTKLRLNGGILFAGDTVDGLLGIRTRGRVFTGGGSIVKQFTPRLSLGVEMSGAVTGNFLLSEGQLQARFGGNYAVRKNMTLDFALIGGRFAASPRVGAQLGFSVDF
jgi:hypothetical protein